jgi:hypothetical protein
MPAIPALWRPRQEDCKFETHLGYIARACFKKQTGLLQWLRPVISVTWEVEIGRIVV